MARLAPFIRKYWVRWLLIVLAVLAVIHYWPRKQLHLVAEIPGNRAVFTRITAARGILSLTGNRTFTFYDWHGRRQWQARAQQPDTAGWGFPRDEQPVPDMMFSLAPQGQVFADVLAHGPVTTVEVWRNGIREDELDVSVHDRYPGLLALDDGTVYLWARTIPPYPIWVIRHGQVVARGTLFKDADLTPDGVAAVAPHGKGLQYARLKVVKDRVVLAGGYHIAEPAWAHVPRRLDGGQGSGFTSLASVLAAGGLVQGQSGAVYGPSGRRTGKSTSAATRHTIMEALRQVEMYQTGVSANGRYQVLTPGYPPPSPLEWVEELWTGRDPDSPPGRHVRILLLRGSRQLVAQLPVRVYPDPWDTIITWRHHRRTYDLDPGTCAISPDGHAVAMRGGKGWLIFRW